MELHEEIVSQEILIVAGLPGCGKTTYLEDLQRRGCLTFDDFKAGAIDDSPAFQKSRKFVALITGVREGHKCVLADIDFCRSESREEAASVLGAAVPGLKIHWFFFRHDESACEENIRRRNRDSLAADLRELRKYSRLYVIPKGADVRPLWRPGQPLIDR
jgi:tRNA splicing ligase